MGECRAVKWVGAIIPPMPEEFEKCRREGGKIRTINGPSDVFDLDEDENRVVCIDDDGDFHWGEKSKKSEDDDESA